MFIHTLPDTNFLGIQQFCHDNVRLAGILFHEIILWIDLIIIDLDKIFEIC